MKKDEKNSSAGRTICTRSMAASTPGSNEPGLRRSTRGVPTAKKNSSAGRTICTRSIAASTPGSNEPGLRRSTRGVPTAKPVTPASATRKSDRPTPSPVSVSKKSGGKDKKNTPSPLRRSDRGKNVVSSQKGSDNSSQNSDTSSSMEQKKGIKKNSVKESTNEVKKRKLTMSGRSFRALWINNKSEALVASNDKEVAVVSCSLNIPPSNDDDDAIQDDKADCPPSENSETKCLPLEKGTNSILKSTRDAEKLSASPMVETGDDNAKGSPSQNSDTQNLNFSKTSLESNIELLLKRKRDTAESELDACAIVANGDDRVMSSDGVITSLSGCKIDDEPEKCNACGKRQKINCDFENLSICSCIAQPVKESDHVEQETMGAKNACSLQHTSVGTQPDKGPNIEGQNIITTAEPLITGSGAVESGDYAVSDQETMGAQDACSLPPTLVGTQPDIGPNIEGQNITTTAEPLVTGPGAVESGDYAVSDQETMGAQDACSLPPTIVATQHDIGPYIEGQSISTVAQLPTDGLDAVESGGSLVLDQCAEGASPLPLSSPVNNSNIEVNTEGVSNTTVAEPRTTGSDACEMEIAEPGPQVERSTFANIVHESGVEPSASVTAPVPSVITNSMGQNAVQPVPQIPFPVFSDPFLHELEKLGRESEYSKKAYQEKKSVLKNEFERKIAELQAEYQRKVREAEAEHNTKSEEINTQKNFIMMNKLLANAFLSNCTEKKTSPSEDPRGRIQQLAQRAIQENALRNHIASTPAQSRLHPEAPSSISRSSGRPLNSTVCLMPQPRQPLIFNISPTPSASPATNQVANASLRHPAPHLTPTPSASPAANQVASASLRRPAPHLSSYRPSSLTPPVSTATLTSSSPLTSSSIPQAVTYSGVITQQQQP